MKFLFIGMLLQLTGAVNLINNLDKGDFSTASFSVCAMYDDGTVLIDHNAGRKMNPASTFKTVTTGAALMRLGADYTWETTIACSGSVRDSVLLGDVHVIGGGDPMLGSDDNEAIPLESVYGRWYEILRDAGIASVKGNIIGDGTWLRGYREEPSWSYEDIGTYYGTCASGLNFYENMVSFGVSAVGLNEGDKPSIGSCTPSCPWMSWEFDCSVGPQGTGDRLYMFSSDLCERAIVRGTYAAGKEGTLKCRNNYPERTLALNFKSYLQNMGVKVDGEAIGVRSVEDTLSAHKKSGKLNILGTTASVPLSTVITRTNRDSNNLYAELLLRTLGFESCGSTELQSSLDAQLNVLGGALGLSTDKKEIMIWDGSGLSRKNLVSPRWMCGFLSSMKRKCPQFDAYLHSLLKYSSRCYYKTGSFSGCRCLCGYLLPAAPGGRTMTFCIMVNNSEMKTSQIDKLEKQIIGALAAN